MKVRDVEVPGPLQQEVSDDIEDTSVSRGTRNGSTSGRGSGESQGVAWPDGEPFLLQEADIALGPFGITYNRALRVDFTESLFYDPRAILSMKGTPEINPWGFLFPLTGTVWYVVAAALAVVWLTTLLVGRRPGELVSLRWTGEVFLQNVRVFLNQGLTGIVLGQGGLMVLLSWVIVSAVVFWSYNGALISLLAVRNIPQPIQTLRDLLDDHSITLVLLPMTILTDTISKMKSGEFRELHELKFVGRIRYEPPKAFKGLLETKVRTDRYSLQSTSLTLDLLIADDFLKTQSCDFYKTRQTFFTTSHCIIGQKDSPLFAAINHRVRAVVESGLYLHWLMKEIPAITNCRYTPSIITVKEPLSFANLWDDSCIILYVTRTLLTPAGVVLGARGGAPAGNASLLFGDVLFTKENKLTMKASGVCLMCPENADALAEEELDNDFMLTVIRVDP
ncbi:hypothetical protein O3P69_002156 [Scylla paramamosain]|uniref:Uncharacterized protein n=1 Tax=Scylla paramamosain TaxID=85552 RepID=A0AAW0V542_SCYPA